MSLSTILAIGWSPEIRGILIAVIGVVTFMGSVYLVLGTNLGARLGFLVSLACLAGWMFIMGIIWWVYGIGFQGRTASWKPAHPVTIVNDGDLVNAGILPDPSLPTAPDGTRVNGWKLLPEEDAGRGQAIAAADVILQETETLAVGEYLPVDVYDKGGDRWPRVTFGIGETHHVDLDFLAFKHDPHYVLVGVQGVVPKLNEPGRAPAKPEVDPDRPIQYVMMIRDLGSRRQPAIALTFGSGLIMGILCWMMSRRDKVLATHLSGGSIEKAPAGA